MKKILSLFSGAGGIDIGFKSNSFETYAAIDNWQVACETLKKNKDSIILNIRYKEIVLSCAL